MIYFKIEGISQYCRKYFFSAVFLNCAPAQFEELWYKGNILPDRASLLADCGVGSISRLIRSVIFEGCQAGSLTYSLSVLSVAKKIEGVVKLKKWIPIALLVAFCIIGILFIAGCNEQSNAFPNKPNVPIATQINFVGDTKTMVYHNPTCKNIPKPENTVFLDSPIAAKNANFKPCKKCKPADF